MIRRARAAGPLLLVALSVLCACTASEPPGEPAPPGPGGCVSDADCGAGRSCASGGSCEDQGGGGGDGGTDACKASDDCRDEFGNVPTIYWDGDPGIDQVCTEPRRSCQGSVACDVATVCADAVDGATRPGGVSCERDEQCFSGRCLVADGASGPGICLRACAGNDDCPYVMSGGVPVGLVCSELLVGNVKLQACLPAGEPDRTLCRRDADCGPSSDDEPPADGRGCRFSGAVDWLGRAVPLCELPPPEVRPTGTVCTEGSSCDGGACFRPCESNQLAAQRHWCDGGERRCTEACELDRDCPARTFCASTLDGQRAGDWLLPFQPPEYPGRTLRICQLPADGCEDELHCYADVELHGELYNGWNEVRTRCSVVISPPASRPRLLTLCLPIDGRTAPGECCAAHADCDSDLCVPARAGTPCEGGGVCSVPCDPVPDPDGIPGSGDEQDRCALADFGASTYHAGSSCQPFAYEYPGADAGEPIRVELRACL